MTRKAVSEGGEHQDRGQEPVAIGSPEMFRAIVESSVSPFVVLDLTGHVVWAGPHVEQLFGEPPEAVLGIHFLEALAPESHEAAIAAFGAFAGSTEAQPWIGPPMLLELLRADETTVTCEVSASLGVSWGIEGVVLQIRRWRGTVLLYEAVDALASGAAAEDVLRRLIELVEHDSPGSVATVLTGWDGARWTMVLHAPTTSAPTVAAARSLSEHPGAVRAALRKGVAVGSDRLDPALATMARGAGYEDLWVVPVPVRDEPQAGSALLVWRQVPGPPLAHLMTTVGRVSRLLGLAIEHHRTSADLRRAALTDDLTGLGSRAALDEHLAQLGDGPRSTLFCDLDGFKDVNDRLGHEVGDAALRVVAERIRGALRPGDVAIRWGGDEFAVVCKGPVDPVALAERIIERVNEPISVGEHRIQLGISIGVAISNEARSIEELLRHGDDALRTAKSAGKNRWLLVSADLS